MSHGAQSLPVRQGPSFLELIQRNGHPLDACRRGRWMAEMSRPVRRRERLPLPRRLILELANTCSLDCPMCRVGRHGANPDRFMREELFESVASELFPHLAEVRLNGLGEATLVPWFARCVRRVAEAGLQGELITALTCDRATIDALLEARFVVLVSWDAAAPRLFEALRRPARFGVQSERLRYLGDRAAARGHEDDLHLLFTLQPANLAELPGVVDLAASASIPNVVVNVVKRRREGWLTQRRPGILETFRRAEAVARSAGVRLFLPDHLAGEAVAGPSVARCSSSGCDRPWREVVVRWNGEITACNMFNPFAYGHWERHGLQRAWNGPLAHAFRRLANTDHRHPYCDDCYYMEDVYARRAGGGHA